MAWSIVKCVGCERNRRPSRTSVRVPERCRQASGGMPLTSVAYTSGKSGPGASKRHARIGSLPCSIGTAVARTPWQSIVSPGDTRTDMRSATQLSFALRARSKMCA